MPKDSIALPYNDYVQSANTLFHFMGKLVYLKSALEKRAIVPRYCTEDVGYLGIQVDGMLLREIAVLQKCFCDIPFHKLTDTFEVEGVGENFAQLTEEEKNTLLKNNSHPDFYGKFAIAFSKAWGEQHNLQPVQYITENAAYAVTLKETMDKALNEDDLPDFYADDLLRRLAYMKPLRGIMSRTVPRKGGDPSTVKIQLRKNFHDEREWRYVPDASQLKETQLEAIIANPKILALLNGELGINQSLMEERYRMLWLTFDYDDIRYIIVPDAQGRMDLIEVIEAIPDEQFTSHLQAQKERPILISKILVLDEVRKDW